MRGLKDGKEKTVYVYNICDHEECYAEVGSQAISYTTGVPAMIGTKMVAQGLWRKPGVWNMEQFDPDPFMKDLNVYGLPWQCLDVTGKYSQRTGLLIAKLRCLPRQPRSFLLVPRRRGLSGVGGYR